VDQLERETALCQAREKSLKENTDKEKAKWNLERQETRKQLLALQGKDTQYLVRHTHTHARGVLHLLKLSSMSSLSPLSSDAARDAQEGT
jgi:hypothetical protein